MPVATPCGARARALDSGHIMGSAALRDFEVHVHDALTDGGYPVTMRVPSEDRIARGVLRVPFGRAQIERALAWMERGLFDEASVRDVGRGLFDAMFDGDLAAFYRASVGADRSRVRLRLVIDVPDVARVPWELLFDPVRGSYLALDGPVVRGLSLPEAARSITVAPPLRILVIDAFPRGTRKLAGHVETASIRRALTRLVDDGRVDVVSRSHVTLRSLQAVLRQAMDREPPKPFHVLHVIGHGHHDDDSGTTVLLLEDETGERDAIDAQTLVSLLRPFDLKLVVLNACDSVQASAFDVSQGFAPALLASGVPAVIGMQVSVLDEVATRVTADFYAALADGQSVDVALTDARIHLRGVKHRRKADMAIPVCYLRTATGALLERSPEPPAAEGRPWYRRVVDRAGRVAPWVVGLGSTALVVAMLSQHLVASPAPITPMGAELNIAVTVFGERDASGRIVPSRSGTAFAEVLYEALVERLHGVEEVVVEVLPPASSGTVNGQTSNHLEASAEALARELNAHILLYGFLELGEHGTVVTTMGFLRHQPRLVEEAYGPHVLSEFTVQSDARLNTRSMRAVREHLVGYTTPRAHATVALVLGLSHYEVHEYEAARASLLEALTLEHGLGPRGHDLAHVVLSAVAMLDHDLDGADRHVRAVLDGDPNHALALLSRAQIELRRATDLTDASACRAASTDVEGLRSAIAIYEQVLQDGHGQTSTIPLKASLLLGHACLCASYATRGAESDAFRSRAIASFEHVVARHGRAREPSGHLVAEAHASLGLVAHRAGRRDDALAAYERALALGSPWEHQRRAVWLNDMARIHLDRDECAAAKERLDAAEEEYAKFRRQNPTIERTAFERSHASTSEMRERSCAAGTPASLALDEEARWH
jgi:tetratricopeptide (TPR) repeat protein